MVQIGVWRFVLVREAMRVLMNKHFWVAGIVLGMTFGGAFVTTAVAEKTVEERRQEEAATNCAGKGRESTPDVNERIAACSYVIENSDQLKFNDESLKPLYMAAFHYNRGMDNHTAGNLPEALDDLNKSIEFNPDNVLAYYERGLVFKTMANAANSRSEKADSLERAKADFEECLRRDPSDATGCQAELQSL